MNTETKQEIIGIVMCHGENDYGYWGRLFLDRGRGRTDLRDPDAT